MAAQPAPAPARTRRRQAAGVVALALVASPLAALPGTAQAAPAPTLERVVVAGPGAAAAVTAAGGRVLGDLALVRGVVAELPAGTRLAGLTVAADRPLRLTALPAADKPAKATRPRKGEATPAPAAPTGEVTPGTALRATLGLPPTGSEGRGVVVAVVDTGVAEHADLAGRIVRHVDVTRTATSTQLDGYGHGTFLAGLLAGDGSSSGGAYTGVAPGASILDVRVAEPDGATTLSQVLAGLQEVVDAKERPRVVSLALGSDAVLPPALDPLAMALDAMWRRGIVVVVPTGNDGTDAPVSSPGSDPLLLTVGSVDDAGTADRSDDTVAAFSSRGTVWGSERPDLVAPGASTVGLRAVGSLVDRENPGSRVAEHYFRGSGTSMSTAVTAGAVADLLSVRPDLSPDDVKALLVGTAYPADGLGRSDGAGAGGLDLAAALAQAPQVSATPAGDEAVPGDPKEWRKLSRALADGDATAAAKAWDRLDPAARTWVARTWASLTPETRDWAARTWAGRTWAGGTSDDWAARTWAARTWAGRTWADSAWTGRTWADAEWSARTWNDTGWDARTWAGRTWAGRTWAGRTWAGRTWAGRTWAGGMWA